MTEIILDPFIAKLAVSSVAGVVISGLSVLAAEKGTFDARKFAYTLGLTTLSALAIVDTVQNGITGENVIAIFLQIIGASFLGNKLFGIGDKLRGFIRK